MNIFLQKKKKKKKNKRCEPQQIYNETFLLIRPNIFSLQHVILLTHID